MAKENTEEEKRIIVDEDWKQQAQKEKEILAAQEKAEQPPEPERQKRREPLPKGTLAALISMLVTQALFSMGLIKVEGQKDRQPDLELARYNIDMLETLEEKTKGNLSEGEEKALTTALDEVRMAYVKVSG